MPTMMPGTKPTIIGNTRCQTFGTLAIVPEHVGVQHDLDQHERRIETRFARNSSAMGTVIDENPYPSAPLTMAATSVMAARAIGKDSVTDV